jgi:nucleotide-binding universal stress UspA family protein
MEKIIAAIDGLKYSKSTAYYATHLAKQAKAHLVGVFLDDLSYTSYKIYDLLGNEGVTEEKRDELDKKDTTQRAKAAQDFIEDCKKANVNYTIHHDRNIAIQELLNESIYADLLIIDSKETLTHHEEKPPTGFIHNLLADVKCPVLVVPQKYKPIEKIVFLYDGDPTSVFAIKTFSSLFPNFGQLPVEVVSVKNNKHPDNRLMKEFMKQHYSNISYSILEGSPKDEIPRHLKDVKENILIVTGAYGRNTVSRLFKPSLADTLMHDVKVPLFIAHNK